MVTTMALNVNALFKKAGTATKKVPAKKTPAKKFGTKKVAPKKAPVKRSGGSDRKLWYPGAVSPPYLDGTLPGDRGCDPFGLSAPAEYLQFGIDQLDQNKAAQRTGEIIGQFKGKKTKVDTSSQFQPYDEVFGIERFRECEIIHGRWAMLAVLGIVVGEQISGVSWIQAGAVEIDSVNYAGLELPFTIGQLSFIEALLIGYIEVARNTTSDPELRCYPGGPFDPLNLASADAATVFSLKEAEIKHSRLAMIAFLGCAIQGLKTGASPLENLTQIGQ